MLTKPRSGGGLLLLRRKAPLKRRSVAYFCSGAHKGFNHHQENRVLKEGDRRETSRRLTMRSTTGDGGADTSVTVALSPVIESLCHGKDKYQPAPTPDNGARLKYPVSQESPTANALLVVLNPVRRMI